MAPTRPVNECRAVRAYWGSPFHLVPHRSATGCGGWAGGGGAGIEVLWALPGAGPVPIPMTPLSPRYGLQSISTSNDALAAHQSYTPHAYTQFADPTQGKPTDTWVHQAPGIKGALAWEAFDPGQGTFGRKLSSTLPAGNSTTYEHCGADETVDIPCDGMGSTPQSGMPKAMTRAA